MNATMITCPGCGAEIPLKRSARGAISARERGTPESSRRPSRAKGARRFRRRKTISRRPARRGAAPVPGGAAGRARTAQGKRGARSPRPRARPRSGAPRRRREAAGGRTAGPQTQGEGQADRGFAHGARRRQAQERAGLAGAPGRSVGDRHRGRARPPVSAGCDPAGGEGRARRRPRARGARPHPAGARHDRLGDQEHPPLAAAWIDKLKADQRAIGANLAVLVSTALPDGLVEFGRLDGVWVAGLRAWPALAVALREQLIEVAFAHAAAEGKSEKMELLYRYLAGDQFRRRIEATVEAFTALQSGLAGERRAMERIWKEREKQIDRVLANTAGMYGEVRGILGHSVPPVPALELDAVAGRLVDASADMVG